MKMAGTGKVKRILNCVVPVTFCNFACHYCYLVQKDQFDGQPHPLHHSLEHMQKALTMERLGGPCMMNLCAVGETLLAPYLVELTCRLLDEGHYVTIVTNGSVKKPIQELCELPEEEKERLFFKFSYQFLQLKKKKLLDVFFAHVEMVKKAGISYTIEVTANDETIPFLEEMNGLCEIHTGAKPHIIESRDMNNGLQKLTKLSNEEHMRAWAGNESPLIEFQDSIWGEHRKEFCYAGDWIATLYLESGWLAPCFGGGPGIQNIFEDIDEPIHFHALGCHCMWEHCYAAHVLLTLGGIPELETPTYASLRNRNEGQPNEWLKPKMKDFMASRFHESNEEYSFARQTIVNWYRGLQIQDGQMPTESELVLALKQACGWEIDTVGIVEDGLYSTPLAEAFTKAGIRVNYVLDIGYTEESCDWKGKLTHWGKVTVKRLKGDAAPRANLFDVLPQVDALIFTDPARFAEQKRTVQSRHEIKAVLLTELA